ncbi:MAG: sporulation transcription factor Spo0A [Bacillota bacterium]
MTDIRVVIADANRNVVQAVAEYLQHCNGVKIVGVAYHGMEALAVVGKENPDVLVLDLIMPYLDGIGVLQGLRKTGLKPAIIVLSSFRQPAVWKTALDLGANYLLTKPFLMEDLHQFIQDGAAESGKVLRDPKPLILRLLQELGFSSASLGYLYTAEAILRFLKASSQRAEMALIYQEVARKVGTNASRVERAIRFAIEKAWTRGHLQVQDKIFGYSVNNQKGKPTNALFIAKIADKIRLESRCGYFA